jgi:hypothetical protein
VPHSTLAIGTQTDRQTDHADTRQGKGFRVLGLDAGARQGKGLEGDDAVPGAAAEAEDADRQNAELEAIEAARRAERDRREAKKEAAGQLEKQVPPPREPGLCGVRCAWGGGGTSKSSPALQAGSPKESVAGAWWLDRCSLLGLPTPAPQCAVQCLKVHPSLCAFCGCMHDKARQERRAAWRGERVCLGLGVDLSRRLLAGARCARQEGQGEEGQGKVRRPR